jgi:hypothetical protein
MPCDGLTAEVSGIVTAPDGTPLRGAVVGCEGVRWDANCRSGISELIETLSDSTGSYRIQVRLGKGQVLLFRSEGFPRRIVYLDEIVPAGLRVDFQFERFHIRGTVVDVAARPEW